MSPNSASTTAVFSETNAGDTSFNSQAISLDVDVQPNDELVFEIIPGTMYAGSSTILPGVPIDPKQITWNPVVAYTNMCRADSNTGQNICDTVK